jgi:hypothetical protein
MIIMNNKYNPVYIRRYNFKVDMTCRPIFNKSNTTCDTSEAGTAYPSGAHIVLSAHVAPKLPNSEQSYKGSQNS